MPACALLSRCRHSSHGVCAVAAPGPPLPAHADSGGVEGTPGPPTPLSEHAKYKCAVCVGGGRAAGARRGTGLLAHNNLPLPHPRHTPLRYLLNLDGFAASTRLGKLLAMNSLVLKQESRHLEHYYRSILPCVHYVPIWTRAEGDVYDAYDAAQARAGD